MTIGTRDMGSNIVCGFFLTLAGNSGVKGIRASEGYALINRGVWEPSWCLIHGLRELFLLQLENVAAELFIVPSDAFTLCQRLMPETSSFPASKSNQALRILLGGILQIRALPCLKGRFFDAMKHKLDQLARSRSNELVPLNFGPVIAAVCQAGVEVSDKLAQILA